MRMKWRRRGTERWGRGIAQKCYLIITHFSDTPKARRIDYVVCHKYIAFLFVLLLDIFLSFFVPLCVCVWVTIRANHFSFNFSFFFFIFNFKLCNKSWAPEEEEEEDDGGEEANCVSLREIRLGEMRLFIHFFSEDFKRITTMNSAVHYIHHRMMTD